MKSKSWPMTRVKITVAQTTGYQSTGKKAKVPKPTKKKVDSGSQKVESKNVIS